MTGLKPIVLATLSALVLSGCAVHKVVTVPAKGVYETTKFAGKTVIGAGELTGKAVVGTAELTGKTVVGTTKLVGKGVIATGKGVYYMGTVPVKITDKALDTTAKVLTITTQAVDLSGKVVSVSRDISALQLEQELKNVKRAKNVLSVLVDVAKT